ncbi:MAG: hypothetical protein WCK55_17705 [Verrucomicrobiota bacterium]
MKTLHDDRADGKPRTMEFPRVEHLRESLGNAYQAAKSYKILPLR